MCERAPLAAAREHERSGSRPRRGEDRGGHGVAAPGGFLRYEWAVVNNRFEFESDKTNVRWFLTARSMGKL